MHIPLTFTIAMPLLLSACGEQRVDPTPAITSDSVGPTRSASEQQGPGTQRETVTTGGELLVTAAETATPVPTSAVSPQPSSVSSEQEQAEAPVGVVLGTPIGGEPVNKSEATSASTVGSNVTPRTSNFDSDGDGFMTTDEFIQALRATYPMYTWPPGYWLDLDDLVANVEEQDEIAPSRHENGGERTLLGLPFLCAWQYTLRDAMYVGDEKLIAESIEQLRTELESNPMFVEIRQLSEDAVDKTELGDPGPLQQLIQLLGCSTMNLVSGTPESASLPRSGSDTGIVSLESDNIRRHREFVA